MKPEKYITLMPRTTLVLRSPCVRAMNSLQTTTNQRKIFFEGRDKVREATGTIIAINRRCTYRTGVARELARNEKEKRIVGRHDYTLSTDKQRLSLTLKRTLSQYEHGLLRSRVDRTRSAPLLGTGVKTTPDERNALVHLQY